jgi:hypothetical protein
MSLPFEFGAAPHQPALDTFKVRHRKMLVERFGVGGAHSMM